MKNYVSQSSLQTYVVAVLFAAAQTDRPSRNQSEISSHFKFKLPMQRYEFAVEELFEKDAIDFGDDSSETETYSLTSTGYKEAESLYLEDEESIFHQLVDKLAERMASKSPAKKNVIEFSQAGVPASDRLVSISDNMPGYSETLTAVEDAKEKIRSSNMIDTETKGWVQSNLEAGLEALRKGGTLLKDGLRSFLLRPLSTALKSESEGVIKEAIKAAISALKTYLGL